MNFGDGRINSACGLRNQQNSILGFYSGLPEGMSFDRSMVRSLFPTGEFRAMNRMHSQNPLRSPGAWQAYR